jgi:3-dehydroquinate synthase
VSDATAVRIDLGERSYDIVVGREVLADAGKRMRAVVRREPAIVVTDATVAKLHLSALERSLDGAGIGHVRIVLPAGEQTKSFGHLETLLNDVLDTRPERRSCLVALGGGVIGDVVGLAASLVLRGIDYVQIPTTLLAQVDSSVGGKTAIDTRHGKNLVGAFYQPRLVLADTGVLDTLPRRELLAGYAEVVKYGLIGDRAFFEWCESDGHRVIAGEAEARRHAVVTSCRAKAAVVAADEREAAARALLNFGHTFGHALETETFGSLGDPNGAALLHGEAVALGMVLAFELSAALGLCPATDVSRVRRHFEAVGLPTSLRAVAGRGWSVERLLAHMHQDKKVRDGRLAFVLTRGIGSAFVERGVAAREVARLLEGELAA